MRGIDTTQRLPIVVGIDGSPGAEEALTWALQEARHRNAPVCLVHAYGSDVAYAGVPIYGNIPLPEAKLDRVPAKGLVREAAERAAELAPDVVVTTQLVADSAALALVQASRTADLLVVGSRRIGALQSFVVGSVSAAVSLRAACPVVVARGPAGLGGEQHGLVVGVDGRHGSQSALAFAFDHASRNSLPLRAVFCWHPDFLAEMMWRAEQAAPSRADAILSETLAGWREKFPDVTVHAGVTRIHPVAGLVAASGAEDLLVVGRSGRHELATTLLGSVTMGVLHHATCPVAVVPDVWS